VGWECGEEEKGRRKLRQLQVCYFLNYKDAYPSRIARSPYAGVASFTPHAIRAYWQGFIVTAKDKKAEIIKIKTETVGSTSVDVDEGRKH
jgi:hypothetical protein